VNANQTDTGLISRALIPNTKKIVGVDVSHGMVEQFNARVKDQGLSPEQAHAVVAYLKGNPGELDDRKFDVAIVSPHSLCKGTANPPII
jgi:ubiquinone/menaquinone biosynthesis C-methylase UbiE